MPDRAGELLVEVDLDAADADPDEAEAELLADAGGDAGVPEAVAGAGEAVELGAAVGEELVLGGGGHGDDGGGGGVGDLGGDLAARQHQAEQVVSGCGHFADGTEKRETGQKDPHAALPLFDEMQARPKPILVIVADADTDFKGRTGRKREGEKGDGDDFLNSRGRG